MDSNVADVERAVCAGDRHPLADMAVRDRHLRRSRHLPQGGHGVNAPVARPKDFPTMALGLVCSRQAKDVVAGYRRVRATVEGARLSLDRARRLLITPRRHELSYSEHIAILQAILEGDALAARAAMNAHLDSVMEELEAFSRTSPAVFADTE